MLPVLAPSAQNVAVNAVPFRPELGSVDDLNAVIIKTYHALGTRAAEAHVAVVPFSRHRHDVALMGQGIGSGPKEHPDQHRPGSITHLLQQPAEEPVQLEAYAVPMAGDHLVVQVLQRQGTLPGAAIKVQIFEGHGLQMPPHQPGEVLKAVGPVPAAADSV